MFFLYRTKMATNTNHGAVVFVLSQLEESLNGCSLLNSPSSEYSCRSEVPRNICSLVLHSLLTYSTYAATMTDSYSHQIITFIYDHQMPMNL